MSTFDHAEVAAALPEVTQTNGPVRLTEDQLRQAGWAEKQPFDYDSAMAKPSDVAKPADASEAPAAEGGEEVPGWAHNAAKYEWSQDYGDVGPKIPELE
ncbi:MAG: hypothetical protein M1823_009158, partial [Watsoniomyces obsoletus]